jgi:hypothetical protein
MENLHELVVVGASNELANRIRGEYDLAIYNNDGYERDPDRIKPHKKTVYLYDEDNDRDDIGIDNIVVLNRSNLWIKNSAWLRTVHIYDYRCDLDKELKGLHLKSISNGSTVRAYYGYRMAHMLGLNFFELSCNDQSILSTEINNKNDAYYTLTFWQNTKNSSINEEQIKLLTYLPIR